MSPDELRRLSTIVGQRHPKPSLSDAPVTYYTSQAIHAVADGLTVLADDLEREAKGALTVDDRPVAGTYDLESHAEKQGVSWSDAWNYFAEHGYNVDHLPTYRD